MTETYMRQPTYTGHKTFLKLPTHCAEPPDISIIGIPFDLGTTNRPGARFGPDGLRAISAMLANRMHPLFRLNPANILSMVDRGDLEVANGQLDQTLTMIEQQAAGLGGHIVSLGGDHTITLPLLRALSNKHGKGISLVHFDAHVDTWKDNFGTPVGHGTPFHYAAQEGLINPGKSVQIGIRSPCSNEIMDYTRDLGFNIISAQAIHRSSDLSGVVEEIRQTVGTAPVYLTFDIDCIDPSQAPGTGTPEIGGLFTWQAKYILENIVDLNWVGMDLVEVAPAYDHAQITALAGATFVWTYLCGLASRK
jgi:agmatinase